jgi:hypothetical protein
VNNLARLRMAARRIHLPLLRGGADQYGARSRAGTLSPVRSDARVLLGRRWC